jgi:rfaE bifunctional protein nucleotidyltransferase chain/domain
MFYTITTIQPVAAELRSQGKSLVLVTGFFDRLHPEHINFLQKARAVGDILITAVESDARARKLKGEGRPLEPQSARAEHILELGLADYCILLPDDFDHQAAYESLLSAIRPATYAVSSHTDYQENKQLLMEKYGGKLVVVHDFNPAISTTKLISANEV